MVSHVKVRETGPTPEIPSYVLVTKKSVKVHFGVLKGRSKRGKIKFPSIHSSLFSKPG